MSVGAIIGGGVNFVRRQPKLMAVWMGIYILIMLATMGLMLPFSETMLAFQQQATANAARGIKTPPVFPSDVFGVLFLVEFAALFLFVIAFAAVVRAVSRPFGDRFAYLRLGMDEVRLIGLGVVLAAAGIIYEIVAVLVVVLLGLVAGAVLGKPAGIAIGAVAGLAFFVAAIWLEVRISLSPVYTILRRRIVIGPAWRATRGRFWTLFGVYVLLTVIVTIVSLAVMAIVNAHLLAAYFSFDQRAVNAALQEQLARQRAGFSVSLILQMLLGAVLMVGSGVVTIASMATAAIAWGADAVEEPVMP